MPINNKHLNMSKVVEFTMRHEIDRNTTKTEYKAIKHWLRICAWAVSGEVINAAKQAMSGLMIYGQSVVKHENGEITNIPLQDFYKCQA